MALRRKSAPTRLPRSRPSRRRLTRTLSLMAMGPLARMARARRTMKSMMRRTMRISRRESMMTRREMRRGTTTSSMVKEPRARKTRALRAKTATRRLVTRRRTGTRSPVQPAPSARPWARPRTRQTRRRPRRTSGFICDRLHLTGRKQDNDERVGSYLSTFLLSNRHGSTPNQRETGGSNTESSTRSEWIF